MEQRIRSFDPDSDGLVFGYKEAYALNKNINILEFIRKRLLPKKAKLF